MFTEREKVANVRGNRNFRKRSSTFPKNFSMAFFTSFEGDESLPDFEDCLHFTYALI